MSPAFVAMSASALVVVAVGMFLTRPLEIRDHRWPCILMSIPLVCLVVNIFMIDVTGNAGALAPGIAAILAMAGLGFVWGSVFSFHTSGGVMRLVTGNMNANSGITPDLRLTKWHHKEGRVDQALDLLLEELEKDEHHYESVVLLASLHEEKNDIAAAHAALLKLHNSGRLIGVQVDMIEERKKRLEEKLLVEQLNAGK
jgi:hypothetical protein